MHLHHKVNPDQVLPYNNQDQELPCSSQGLERLFKANQSGQELNL